MEVYNISKEEFNNFSANYLYEKFKKLETVKKTINIALSGGNTPLPILNILKDFTINWKKYNFFIVDERNVPLSHSESNYGNIKKVFFNKISAKSFSIIKENKTIDESIDIYIKEIYDNIEEKKNNIPVFDYIILGMGDDGHIASLFPESNALNEQKEIVSKNYVSKLKTTRLTMTFPLILNAKEIITIIKGTDKKQILENIKEKGTNYPIKRVIESKVKQSFVIGI